MTTKLPCTIVRDLLPSYVDGLTGPETNEAVEGHVAECAPCRALLDEMRAPAPAVAEPEEAPEVDYLKKVRRDSGRRSLRNSILTGLIIAAIFLAAVWRLWPRSLADIIDLEHIEEMDIQLTVTKDGDFAFYELNDLKNMDLPLYSSTFNVGAVSYEYLFGIDARPSFRNLLPNIETVSSGKAYDGRSLHISLHGDHDNVNRGIFINFLDPITFSVTDPDGDLQIYYATGPGWFDIIADHVEKFGTFKD